jgi:AcrR family transcriptional regulator
MARRSPSPKPRPGGRSSRVKDAVFAAVEALLLENPGDLPSMAAIAARAGVNPTSLYRRWGDVRRLAGEVAVNRMMREHPMPNTGSVRGDLIAWATSVASSISTRRNVMLLRILTSVPSRRVDVQDLDKHPIGRRVAELESMLGRGAKRGERVPTLGDVLELVLAPIYLHALFLGPIGNPRDVERLVDRALSLAQSPRSDTPGSDTPGGARPRTDWKRS